MIADQGCTQTASAVGTVKGEAPAKIIASTLYNKASNELTKEEKLTVSTLSQVAAGIAGGLAAGQGADGVKLLSESSIGATVGNNAVEHNYLSVKESQRKAYLEGKKILGAITSEEDKELELLNKTDIDRDIALVSACSPNPLSTECNIQRRQLESMKVGYTAAEYRSLGYGYPVYIRYSEIYPEQSEKINQFSYDYDVLRISKENANKTFAERLGISKETIDRIDLGGYLLTDLLSGYAASKINPKGVKKEQSSTKFDPRTEKLNSVLPTGHQILDPSEISFSQATVSYQKKGKGYNYDTMVESMKKDGWNGIPVDVVNMPDKAPTSMDNTRILAARKVGIKVEAKVHSFDEKLTPREMERFQVNGVSPNTWGEAILLRIEKQGAIKGDGIPNNWNIKYPYGSMYDPKVKK